MDHAATVVIEAMANAIAEGAHEARATLDIEHVPETVPQEIAKAAHLKLDQAAPIAKVDETANNDAIVGLAHGQDKGL
jgi:NAD(P)H dehydrogenase (quinone)